MALIAAPERTTLLNPTVKSALALPEVLSAISFALDLAVGVKPGHGSRSCLLGMRIAAEAGLPPGQVSELYSSLLLLRIRGSQPSAARFGHSLVASADGDPGEDSALQRLLRLLPASAQHWIGLPSSPRTARSGLQEEARLRFAQCVQALRVLGIGCPEAAASPWLKQAAEGLLFGGAAPDQAAAVPWRILELARNLDFFATRDGASRALQAVRRRAGTVYDAGLVRVADRLHGQGTLWEGALPGTPEQVTRRLAVAMAPTEISGVEGCDPDLACEALAELVNSRSSCPLRHSTGVAGLSVRMARQLGLREERVMLVRRAALLHDVGKLSVPRRILDKSTELTDREWQIVRQHPRFTREIVQHMSSFREVAMIAGAHHERLDGSGYPDHLAAECIPLEASILAVADVYDALTDDRPYRRGLTHGEAMTVVWREAPHRLDLRCCEALAASIA